jgi:UPF0755 protein
VKVLKLLFFFIIFVIIAGGIAGFFVVQNMLQPVDAAKTEKQDFSIPKGQSISRIGERLTEAGLLRHPLVFRLMVKSLGAEQKIQAGSFQLSPSMDPQTLITAMTQGTDDTWVTLLEGWRREEIAETFAEAGLENFDEEEFLVLTEDKEGYLFPDTYLVQKDFDTEQVISLLENTFERKVETGLKAELAASGKSLKDIVTMASLVQREAKGEQQMKLVAGVLWNRVDINMALNVDATLQYIKGYDDVQNTWWVPPLAVDKERTSLYNTYKHPGLPPGPITNPGLDAVKAAASPTETDYMYYLHDSTGKIHFGETLDEHNANVQKYLR